MDGTVLAQRDADLPFYSASTIKLGVLVAVVQAVERGALDLAQPVAAAHTFPSGAGGGETASTSTVSSSVALRTAVVK